MESKLNTKMRTKLRDELVVAPTIVCLPGDFHTRRAANAGGFRVKTCDAGGRRDHLGLGVTIALMLLAVHHDWLVLHFLQIGPVGLLLGPVPILVAVALVLVHRVGLGLTLVGLESHLVVLAGFAPRRYWPGFLGIGFALQRFAFPPVVSRPELC